MSNTPIVFISYSHDGKDHKKWVAEFASLLVSKGVDVLLDQWDINFGDDIPKYMEQCLNKADKVLMICTEKYVQKANDGKGGVGYEAMIVTGELVKNLGTSKFVPVIRQSDGNADTPVFLSTRYFANLSYDHENYDEEIENLLRTIHQAPAVTKPRLGKNPYAQSPSGEEIFKENIVTEPIFATPISTSKTPIDIYKQALEIARKGDIVYWRKFVQPLRHASNEALTKWRTETEFGRLGSSDRKELIPKSLEGVSAYLGLMAAALAAVESGREEFKNQIAIIDDCMYPRNWIDSGLTYVVNFPLTIAFIYQALHGAICLHTNQLDLAIKLAKSNVDDKYNGGHCPVWLNDQIIGWPSGFGENSAIAWEAVANLPDYWDLLGNIFGGKEEYLEALSAYYLALNVLDFVEHASNNEIEAEVNVIRPNVPLHFLRMDKNVLRRGYRYLTQDTKKLSGIWESKSVSITKAREKWIKWIEICKYWLSKSDGYGLRMNIVHEGLFDDLK